MEFHRDCKIVIISSQYPGYSGTIVENASSDPAMATAYGMYCDVWLSGYECGYNEAYSDTVESMGSASRPDSLSFWLVHPDNTKTPIQLNGPGWVSTDFNIEGF